MGQDWLLDYGEFSQPARREYFHGFATIEYLIKALDTGQFGRPERTSVGTEKSRVPYYNQIWFIPRKIKLFPVFYIRNTSRYSEVLLELSERFNVNVPQVGQWMYKNEQEWYCPNRIYLSEISVTDVVYWGRAAEDDIDSVKRFCDSFAYECSKYPKEMQSRLLKSTSFIENGKITDMSIPSKVMVIEGIESGRTFILKDSNFIPGYVVGQKVKLFFNPSDQTGKYSLEPL